jgi:hypothetical protein
MPEPEPTLKELVERLRSKYVAIAVWMSAEDGVHQAAARSHEVQLTVMADLLADSLRTLEQIERRLP